MADDPRERLMKLRRLKELRDKASGSQTADRFQTGTIDPGQLDAAMQSGMESREMDRRRLAYQELTGRYPSDFQVPDGMEPAFQGQTGGPSEMDEAERRDRASDSDVVKIARAVQRLAPNLAETRPVGNAFANADPAMGRVSYEKYEEPRRPAENPYEETADRLRDSVTEPIRQANESRVIATSQDEILARTGRTALAPMASMFGPMSALAEADREQQQYTGDMSEIGKIARLVEGAFAIPAEVGHKVEDLTGSETAGLVAELGTFAVAGSGPKALKSGARAGLARAGQNPLTARFPEFIQRAAADAVPLPETSVGHMPWDFAREGELSPGRPPTVPRVDQGPGIPPPSRKAQMSAQSKALGDTMQSSLKRVDRALAEKRRAGEMGPRAPRQFDRVPEFDAEAVGIQPSMRSKYPIADVPAAKPVEPLSPPPKSPPLPEAGVPGTARELPGNRPGTAPKPEPVIEPRAVPEPAAPAKPTADPGIEYRHSTPLDAMWDGTKRVAKAGESVYDGVDAALAERISKPIARTIRATMQSTKGGRKVADALRDAFQDPLKRISEEFSAEVVRGRGSKELAKIDGAQAGNRLRDALKTLTESDRTEVYRWWQSERPDLPAHLTDQQRAVIQNTVAEIQSLGRELVERGLNSAEAVEQFQRYLPRLYEDSMKGRGALRASRKFRTEEQFTRSDKYLTRMDVSDVPFDVFQTMAKDNGGFAVTRKGKSVQAKFETREARESFIGKLKTERRAAILDDLGIPYKRTADGAIRPNFRNVKASVRDAYQRRVGGDSVISGRKVGRESPLPAEVREMVGEITDPSVAAARAIQSAKSRIATHEFFKRVEKGGDSKGAWTFESEALAPDGAILLSEKWAGPLKGKWVREDVATWLKETHDVGTQMGDFGRAWTAQWKANKTVLSPRTAFRQAYSMPQQLHMAGVNALNPNNWGTFKEAVRALSGDHPLYREMIQNEIIRGALPTHEMKILETIMDRKDLSPGAKWGQILANPVMATEMGRSVQSKMGNYYNRPDALVRASVFLDRINKGMSVKEAVIEVNRYTNNYASVGKAVQWASMSPIVSPFIRFKAETFRNFLNTLEHHPLRAIGALFHTKAARAILGWTLLDEMTDDDWEALDNERGGLEIPTGIDDEGKVWSFDMNFVDIMGDLFPDPVKVGDERALKFITELVGFSESPGIEMLGATNDLIQGKDIRDSRDRVYAREGQDTLDRLGGFTNFYFKSTLPTWTPGIGWHSRAVTAAAKGEKPSPHAPMQELKYALISALFGLNFRQFDPDRELDKLDYQAKKKISALRAQEKAGGNADASYKRLDEDLDKREGALLRSRSSR